MNNTIFKIIASVFLVVICTTCTKNSDEPTSDATSIELLSGDNQTAPAGTLLENPIEVLVKDQFDNAFAETIVNFSVIEGSVSSASAKTDARGIASVNWTLGTSTGEQNLSITAFQTDGETPLLNAPLIVNANVDTEQQEANSLALVSGNNQTGLVNSALEEPIVVIVKDVDDNPLSGVSVTVLVNDGSVNSSVITTDVNALATINWTLGDTEGVQTISIISFKPDGTTPLTGSPLTITANGTTVPAVAETLELVSGDNQTGMVSTMLANPIIVRVLDQFENPFAGATVNFTPDGAESPFTITTDAGGLATYNWTLTDLVSTQNLKVQSLKPDGTTPLTGSPLTITANGTSVPATPETLELVSGDNQTGTVNTVLANLVIVRVLDQFDNPFAGATVNVLVNDGSVSSSSITTDANGLASINWTLGHVIGAQMISIESFKLDGTPLTGSILVITANGTLVAATAESLELVSGDNQTGTVNAALENPVIVRVLDQFDNPFAGATVNILVNDGSVASSSITTNANGLATINWTLGATVGTQTISVMSVKANGTTPLTGSPLTITANGISIPAAAEILELVSGNNQSGTVNTTLANPVIVRVLDQFNNPFIGAEVNILVNDGSVSSTSITTNANGLATINWTLGANVGTQTISVLSLKADGTTPLLGSPLTITANGISIPAAAESLELVSGDNQTGTAGTSLANPVIVRVLDQFNNPFVGASVEFTPDGAESPSIRITDSNGLASYNWTLTGLVNTQNLEVESFKPDGTSPLSGSPFVATATGTAAIGADILLEISGNNQTGTVNAALANPVVVRVLDQFENPFAGATVTVLVNDGTVASSSLTTDTNGFATINWTLGNTIGTQTISVMSFKPNGTTPLTGSPLTIIANASAAIGADILQEVSGGSQQGFINTTLANPIVIRVLDQFENPFAGATVFFTPSNGSVSNQTVVTNSNGEAQTTWTLGSEVTDQLLTVTGFKPDGTTPLSGSPLSFFVSAQAPLAIGDFHEGGVIFYLDNSGESGLVCATSNQADNVPWGCGGTLISGAGGTTLGTGAQNTLDIISGCLESLIAAEWCSSLTLNGFNDWFLPSQDELNQMFNNKAAIDATSVLFGGTALNTNFYWSSTQINANQAWGYNVFGDDFKNNSYAVRAVRSF